mmetsp:Transcript_31978/g.55118  ORF Transcript_31978/g.55118 Transcript_31978/m.55118 type:complete len:506 (+) Transcript_31978:1124-2641(+)
MMKGAIEFLLSDAREAKLLRKYFVFKIVPMLNPDGVRYGNYRTSLLGVDLNRRWNNPHKTLHPTIFYCKKLIQSFSEDRELVACVDMHGHSMKRNVFTYGCCVKNSEFEGKRANVMIKLLPFLLSTQNKCFNFKDCKFRLEKSKETTQRIVIFKELGVLNAYTIEASFYGPSHSSALENRRPLAGEESTDAHFETRHLEGVGRDLCKQFLAFVNHKIFRKKLEFVEKALRRRTNIRRPSNLNQSKHETEEDQLEQENDAEDTAADIIDLFEDSDNEEEEECKLGDLLEQIDVFKGFTDLQSFDNKSDSGGSDSNPSDDDERRYREPRSRPRTRLRIRAKQTKPLKESGSHKHNMLKLRTLSDKRREVLTTSPNPMMRNRPLISEDNGTVLKQTHLRLTLQQHLSQISKIKTLINKSRLPPPIKVRSRQLLQADSQEITYQETMTRLAAGNGGFRNVIFASRARPEFEPADSFVVSSIHSVKTRPTVIWKSPEPKGDELTLNGTVM